VVKEYCTADLGGRVTPGKVYDSVLVVVSVEHVLSVYFVLRWSNVRIQQ